MLLLTWARRIFCRWISTRCLINKAMQLL